MTKSDLEISSDELPAEIGDHVRLIRNDGGQEIYVVDSYNEETDSFQLTEVKVH